MIEYILIESEKECRDNYSDIINKIMQKEKIKYQIYEFNKYTSNLKTIIDERSCYKIYLLDVCLNSQTSGIDIAKYIRKSDLNSEIIFITNHDVMFESVFRTVQKVYCFIEKFQNANQKLKKVLDEIITSYVDQNKFFPIDKKGNTQIALNEILYIYRETAERKVYIVTNKGKYPTNLSLNDSLKFCDSYFKQIHRACIVNTKKVIFYNWNENYFLLNNNIRVLMCSKNYKNNIV